MIFYNKVFKYMPFFALSVFAISVTPVKSDFVLQLKGCEIVPTTSQFMAAFSNYRHLVSFFVLFLSVAFAFGGKRILTAAALTFGLTLIVEFEQAVMVDGHCRAWDLIPNAIAVLLGASVVLMVPKSWRSRTGNADGSDFHRV